MISSLSLLFDWMVKRSAILVQCVSAARDEQIGNVDEQVRSTVIVHEARQRSM
jgi:hypothetical protein